MENNNALALRSFMLFNEELLNSDKLKPRYNNGVLGAAVNVFKINNSFLSINIGDNSIKPASFQPVKILHNTNVFFCAHIYISVHFTYDVRPKLSLY